MNKPKLNQPDVEQSTTLEPNTSITLGAYGTPKSKYFENPTSQIPTDLTIEEVKKEWEKLGYIVTTYIDGKYDWMSLEELCGDKIIIDLILKSYHKYDNDGESQHISLQEHQLLTKTFRALGWEV